MRGLLIILMVVSVAAPAAAASQFQVEGWDGGPLESASGETRCVMRRPVAGSADFIVGLTDAGDVAIGLTHADWAMQRGSAHAIVYRAGTETIVRATALAVRPDTLVAWLSGPDYARHLSPFTRTRDIALEKGDRVVEFQLEGAPRAVEALLDCVQTELESRPTFTQRIIEMFRLP